MSVMCVKHNLVHYMKFRGPQRRKGTFIFYLFFSALRFNQKYLNLFPEDERKSYGFGTT